MRTLITAILIATVWAGAGQTQEIQTDWSGGPGTDGPVGQWDRTFESATDISWRAIPGQLALSSAALTASPAHGLGTSYWGAFGVDTGDFDGDGDVDIVGAAEISRRLTIWHNDGANPPTFTPEIIDASYLEVAAVFVIDVDGDQRLDIVASSGSSNGRVTCYLNQGGSPATWTAQTVDSPFGQAWEIAAADVDDDGHVDIVGTSLWMDSVFWWRNDGQTPIGWTRMTVDAAFDGAHSARARDIDGDGHTDVVACGTTVNEVAWWRNGGDDPITWTKQVIQASFAGGRSVRIADIDDDGDLDVAAVGFNGRLKWWSNEGGEPTMWTGQVVGTSLAEVHQLQIADMNGDGRLDLVAALYGGNNIAWWENGGGSSPITWTRRDPVTSINRPLAVNVGDVDGDGALEILGSTNTQGRFFWWDASAFVATGSLTSTVLDRGAASSLAIDWTADTPPGTSVSFQVRSGEDAEALGPWSADITAPGALTGTSGRYLQYRVVLATDDETVSPLVREVSFHAPVSAVLPGASGLGLSTYPNPANPRVVVAFDLPRTGRVRLDVFDTRGRRVRSLADAVFAAGPNAINWDGADQAGRAAATGTYHVLLRTGQGTEQARVTLVR